LCPVERQPRPVHELLEAQIGGWRPSRTAETMLGAKSANGK